MKLIKKFEAFTGEWDSSIKQEDAKKYNDTLNEIRLKIDSIEDESKFSDIETQCSKRLDVYDKEVKDFVIDSTFYDNNDNLSDEIIKLGDLIMSKHNTEPIQVLNAIDDCFSIIVKI